jgi:predicted membrane channel-forming protein YqfA (hemolysin III family)
VRSRYDSHAGLAKTRDHAGIFSIIAGSSITAMRLGFDYNSNDPHWEDKST